MVEPQGKYIAEWDDSGFWNQAIGYCLLAICVFDIGCLVTRDEGGEAFLQSPAWAWMKICGYIAGLVFILRNLGVRDSASLNRLGFSLTKQDVKLGILASVAILPLAWIAASAMATVAYHFIPQMSTYSHPAINAVKASSLAWEYIPIILLSVILAPASEEIVYRVLIQGHLEYNKIDSMDLIDEEDDSRWISMDCVSKIPWSPILVTSVIFALLHIGFGVIPLSVFVLSMCLGYLYRQTGRFWPCFIVHSLHNLFSILFVLSHK